MASSQKSVVNGLDSAPAASGFRHQLPQIAMMSRNPKIAQSKTASKSDVVATEHSTSEVEGVGKVVHIGSEHMDVDDSAEKKLLDQLEEDHADVETGNPKTEKDEDNDNVKKISNESSANADSDTKMDIVETTEENETQITQCDEAEKTVAEQKVDEKTLEETKAEMETLKETKVEEKTFNDTEAENKTLEGTKVDVELKAANAEDKMKRNSRGKWKSAKSPIKTKPEMKSPARTKTEASPTKASVAKKQKHSKQVAADLDKCAVSSSDETASPVKRQRKPKKFEDESETVAKPPKPPVVEKLSKPKIEVTPELEAKFPVKWDVGEQVWAKVASHPWWPCMVSYDPFTAAYTRFTTRTREYHVQFFGDAAERGWINVNNVLKFEGKAKFDEYTQQLYTAAKNSKECKKLKKWYGVQPHRIKALTIGIAQAESALSLTVLERKAKYTFVYKIPKSQVTETVSAKLGELDDDLKIIQEADTIKAFAGETKSAKKRKHDEVVTPTTTPKNASKRRKVETPKVETKADSLVKNGKKKTSSSGRALSRVDGSFDVFCQKERENVLDEHPEFSEDSLMDYCRQQWCMMSMKQKVRYKSKYTEESDLSQEMSPSSRRRKPSQKVLEAEEDNKVVDEVISRKKQVTPTHMDKTKKSAAVSQEIKARKSRRSVDMIETASSTPRQTSSTRRSSSSTPMPTSSTPKQTTSTPMPTSTSKQTCTVSKQTSSTPAVPVAHKQEMKLQPDSKRKRGRPSKASSDVKDAPDQPEIAVNVEPVLHTDAKPDVKPETTDEEDVIKPITTVIPAKRARPKKSVSTDSDKQSESRTSTPSPTHDLPPAPKKEKEEYEYEMEIYKLSSAAPQKKDTLCQICEQTGQLLECLGPCQGFFHIDCLGLSTAPDGEFKCDECTNGVHSCFVCKKSSSDTQRCCIPVCGKFYHTDCVKQFPQAKVESKGITCPLHSCHTCLANNLKCSAAKSNGRLLRCVRCPTAYHVGDFCIWAGSINLTGFNIVCARHFQPIPSMKHHSHVNVSWCFSCNKGGTLLCCESCPAAYHAECLNIDFPTGSWYCQDCVKGKRPLYGEIIWVKLGNYRWWPGEVCHPRNVPLNIQEKPHQVGEFPVHFLGSHEYFWLHQGRVFSFQDGDKGNGGSSSNKGLAKHFTKGLKEAADAFKVWKEFRDNREQMELAKESKKPAPFKMVKANVPLGSVVIKKADLSELPRCDCKTDQESPCGRDSECLNAMMMYECHPALCPAGEKCENQFFTKRLYPSQQPSKTEGRGWGLKAMADIKKGQFVNEYVGDLIDEEECKLRLEKAHEDNTHNFYMMTLDMDRIIDAGPKGNLSRFMNHCCHPNLETQKWNVNGDVRVGLFALKDITSGDELTFNYNFDCLGNEQTKCACGSENCSGYLGVRPKSQAAATAELKRMESKKGDKLKKKKKPQVKRKHDDDCFRCGEGGELVMCDRNSCTKSYHLRCLSLCKPPYGKWDCPWHHCDICGKTAAQKCVECPNSYCSLHAGTKTREYDGNSYCLEHEELLDTLEESQSQASTASSSDDNGELPSSDPSATEKANGKKENDAKMKVKEETLPPKKRGPKTADGAVTDKPSNGTVPKVPRGRKASLKGEQGTKGSVSDDPLAVAPMFDDDEEEEFGLVIDIPNF